MEKKRPHKKTDFEVGDLIELNDMGILFEISHQKINIGVIASEAYIFVTTIYESTSIDDTVNTELEDWCYDILSGDELVKMMPEEFLELIIIKEDK
jgi:hypothetical protein